MSGKRLQNSVMLNIKIMKIYFKYSKFKLDYSCNTKYSLDISDALTIFQ